MNISKLVIGAIGGFWLVLSIAFGVNWERTTSAQAFEPKTDDNSITDTLIFGNAESEANHQLATVNGKSNSGTGQRNQTFRRILAPETPDWTGGSLKFRLKIIPNVDNYLTFKFSGDQTSPNTLILYFDGKQLGYRHLGDYDCLQHGCSDPPCPGLFYYITTVLPRCLTDGKTELETEVRLTGRIWGYGANFDQFQKAIEGPSLDFYAAFTHRNPCLEEVESNEFDRNESSGEKSNGADTALRSQGQRGAVVAPIRTTPGKEVLDRIRERVNGSLIRNLRDSKPWSLQQAEFEAQGWRTQWTAVFHNPQVLERTIQGADAYYRRWQKDETLSWRDPGQYNNEWFGVAPLCQALIDLDSPDLQRLLDETIDSVEPKNAEPKNAEPKNAEPKNAEPKNAASVKLAAHSGLLVRRQAYAQLIEASRDRLCRNRRQYTNQSMIIDWNIYRMNRGMAVVAPQKCLPEKLVLGFLYESIGLTPWLGAIADSDYPITESSKRTCPLGENYFQLTRKGLTRELGYVGSYGEVLAWVYLIYRSTGRFDAAGNWESGDPAIRDQLVCMAKAREAFRIPSIDADGFRTMRLETSVGWRDVALMGPTAYGLRPDREGSPACAPWITRDEQLKQSFRSMVCDNQFFKAVEGMLNEGGLRLEKALMEIPEQYEALTAAESSADGKAAVKSNDVKSDADDKITDDKITDETPNTGLPMRKAGDFIFTDEQNGLVALKYSDEILYVSLYWRARHAVNFLSKVHLITPDGHRHAIVRSKIEYTPFGKDYIRPNWTILGFGNGGGYLHYPSRFESIHAGETLPIAQIPDFVKDFKPGDENIFAGRGDFYQIRFGKYWIAMNMSEEKTFELDLTKETEGLCRLRDLKTGRPVSEKRISIPPQTTAVLVVEE